MSSLFSQNYYFPFWVTGSLCLYWLSTCPGVQAQIVQDSTFPKNTGTTVTSNGNTNTIAGGTTVGSNLFHSFQEFSVPQGSEAFFNNELDIQNIISRVTGGKPSTIDGILRANGTANLFLINPSGIVFGANAQLNIGGSFIATTADSLKFSDGSEFSVINPTAPPLLVVNAPIGLQFGSNPGTIINRSQANSVLPLPNPNQVGLEVSPGQTLALIGSDVLLEGGNLRAFQGQIELGSVASSGFVSLTPTATGLNFGYQGIERFGTIELSGAAAVNTSGLGGGTIRVRGGDVFLTEGSKLVAETFGDINGRGIDIQANQFNVRSQAYVSTSTFLGSGAGGSLTVTADDVNVEGTSPFTTSQQLLTGTFNPLNLSDGLFSLSGGSGKAGDLTINAARLRLQNGANVLTTAFLNGDGGNLTLNISQLGDFSHGSLLFTGTAGTGNAGNIAITAKQLKLLDGTSISTTPGPTSSGRAGNLTLMADLVELKGTPAEAIVPGGLFTTSLGTGDAGNLTIATNQLRVLNGTQISTSTAGSGRGGDLNVTADTIELSGISADGRFIGGLLASTSLLTVAGQKGNAPAGNLSVTTRRLSVLNGAQISTATGNANSAGHLQINASESVDVRGVTTGADPSVEAVSFGTIGDGIIPSAIEANTRGTGNAGDLTIKTGQLTVRDGAEVGVRSTSSGAPGNLEVRANSILLDNQGTISATSILGQGGDINLYVQNDLVLRHGSAISTRAGTEDTGGGNGGNITIDTGVLAVVEASTINANAFEGAGGRIRITTRGLFKSPDSSITASSTLGVDGIVEINQLDVDPSQGLVNLPENFTDSSDRIVTGCAADSGNKFAITGRGGLPEDPTQTLRGRTVWQDLRLAGSHDGTVSKSGKIVPVQPSASLSQPIPLVEATGWVKNADGQVELVTQTPQVTSWHVSANCGDS